MWRSEEWPPPRKINIKSRLHLCSYITYKLCAEPLDPGPAFLQRNINPETHSESQVKSEILKKKVGLEGLHNYLSPLFDVTKKTFHWTQALVKTKMGDLGLCNSFHPSLFLFPNWVEILQSNISTCFPKLVFTPHFIIPRLSKWRATLFGFVFQCRLIKHVYWTTVFWGQHSFSQKISG